MPGLPRYRVWVLRAGRWCCAYMCETLEQAQMRASECVDQTQIKDGWG